MFTTPDLRSNAVRHLKWSVLLVWLMLTACQSSADSLRHDEYVTTNDGAELYLMTRGADSEAPVLLWLHGGPGAAERPLFRYYNSELEKHFVVAYWDQRGAGRSFDPDASVDALTIDQHLADLDIVVDHLRQRLNQTRIVLVGHSWGGALGLLYSHQYPDKVSALFAVNPLVATQAQQQMRYTFLLHEAESMNDTRALSLLRDIGPPPHPTAAAAMEVETLASQYGAIFHQRPNYLWVSLRGIFTGLVTPLEIPRIIRANNISLDAMHNEIQTLDLFQSVPVVDVPTFMFVGRYDQHVAAEVAADYLNSLNAPVKQLTWFENSAHNIPFEEPDRFHSQLVELFNSTHLSTYTPNQPQETIDEE